MFCRTASLNLWFPWFLRVTTLKSKHLLTSSSFDPTGLLPHGRFLHSDLIQHTISFPGFLWCDGLNYSTIRSLQRILNLLRFGTAPFNCGWPSLLHPPSLKLAAKSLFVSIFFPIFLIAFRQTLCIWWNCQLSNHIRHMHRNLLFLHASN